MLAKGHGLRVSGMLCSKGGGGDGLDVRTFRRIRLFRWGKKYSPADYCLIEEACAFGLIMNFILWTCSPPRFTGVQE